MLYTQPRSRYILYIFIYICSDWSRLSGPVESRDPQPSLQGSSALPAQHQLTEVTGPSPLHFIFYQHLSKRVSFSIYFNHFRRESNNINNLQGIYKIWIRFFHTVSFLLTYLPSYFLKKIGLLRDAASLSFSKQEHLQVTLPQSIIFNIQAQAETNVSHQWKFVVSGWKHKYWAITWVLKNKSNYVQHCIIEFNPYVIKQLTHNVI